MDVTLIVVALPILVPLMGLLCALVRRDGGPGFFSQDRVGMNGRIFRCWKLRTMVVDAEGALDAMTKADPVVAWEWAVNQKLAKDPRITRIGEILRKTSLDELPQLWNVLMGDMSLIGPRPFMPDQKPLYDEKPGSEAYYQLRPGITGLWQVDARNESTFQSRVTYDRLYAEDLSLRSDLVILKRTVGVVLKRTGC